MERSVEGRETLLTVNQVMLRRARRAIVPLLLELEIPANNLTSGLGRPNQHDAKWIIVINRL